MWAQSVSCKKPKSLFPNSTAGDYRKSAKARKSDQAAAHPGVSEICE